MIDAKLFIDGVWVGSDTVFPVTDKFTGEKIAQAHTASSVQVDQAVAAAASAFEGGEIPIPRRYDILMKARDILLARKAEIVDVMIAETGFTRADNEGDSGRCVQTLLTSAEEAKRITGEMIPIEASPGHPGELAFTIRVPLGVVAAITPFNSPLNTVAHKVAPALAAGNAVMLKPASYTPLSAMLLTEVLHEAGLPPGWLNLIHGPGGKTGAALTANPSERYFAFTGGGPAGEAIQAAAGMRRTQMELGNISATIVCADANLDRPAIKAAGISFRKAGQVCTSLQRLYVHETVFADFSARFVAEASKMKAGDPQDPQTAIGPMIDISEAKRAKAMIEEALAAGATLVCGGKRDGSVLPATILSNVTEDMRIMREEIFAPVVCLVPFEDLDDAIARVARELDALVRLYGKPASIVSDRRGSGIDPVNQFPEEGHRVHQPRNPEMGERQQC